jgi:hypothetical protein
MMRFRYIRYCKLSGIRKYWQNKAYGDAQQTRKWSQCMGHLMHSTLSCCHIKSRWIYFLSNFKLDVTAGLPLLFYFNIKQYQKLEFTISESTDHNSETAP